MKFAGVGAPFKHPFRLITVLVSLLSLAVLSHAVEAAPNVASSLGVPGTPRIDTQVNKPAVRQTSVTSLAAVAGANTTKRIVPSTAAGTARAQTLAAVPVSKQRFFALNVILNESRRGNWLLLENEGTIYASEDALIAWNLRPPFIGEPLQLRNQSWYSLAAIAGYDSKINIADQSIELHFSPEVFASSIISARAQGALELTPAIPAAFINYDLAYSTVKNNQSGSQNLGALLELGFSSSLGVLTSNYVGTELIHTDPGTSTSWRRLDTTFTRDFPEKNLSMLVGDGYTRADFAGRSLTFGGFQIGSNYALTSGLVTQARPFITGLSSSPSVVELYVNNALQQTSRVPAGPFTLTNVPLLNGGGEARIVVRDYLGRETVVEQDFFTHSSLLEKDLSEWSYELGAVRQSKGQLNADYGQRFTSGFYRYGLTKLSTLEGRAQWGQGVRNFGIGLSQGLPGQMLGQLFIAQSSDGHGENGAQATAVLAYSSLRQSFIVRAENTSLHYKQMGQTSATASTRSQWSVNYSFRHPTWGTWGAGIAQLQPYNATPISVRNLNYTAKLGRRDSVTVRLSRLSGAASTTFLGVMFTMALDRMQSVIGGVTSRDGRIDGYAAYSQAQNGEIGTSYRALVGTQQGKPYGEAGVYYQGSKGRLTADLNASSTLQALQLGASGGFAVADGQFFTARRIDGSFGIVEVPGYPNLGIGFQGDSLTRTNAEGIAILPKMMAYNRNYVRLNPKELPISAAIDNIEQVIVPRSRTAVKVVFPVRSGRAALIKLTLDDGQPAPAGAEVELVGDKQEFFVARRGEVFVTGLNSKNEIRLKYKEQSCKVAVELPSASADIDEILRLGPLLCSGVKR